jgi:hypothetical protein
MPAFAIPKRGFDQQPVSKSSKREKEAGYLDWIRSLPCLVTRKEGVEAAHVSYAVPAYGKLGRGKGAKESDRWAVPLSPDEHRKQHAGNEQEYWRSVGIDPCITAALLYAAYPSRERALLVINHVKPGVPR